MAHQNDGFPTATEGSHLIVALLNESFVANRQNLIDEQNVGVGMHGDRKPQAHVHPHRIGLHGFIDECFQLGEADDIIEVLSDFALGKAQDSAIDEDVFPSTELRMKASPEIQQCPDFPMHRNLTAIGAIDPRK
jgi:hypothetical protein